MFFHNDLILIPVCPPDSENEAVIRITVKNTPVTNCNEEWWDSGCVSRTQKIHLQISGQAVCYFHTGGHARAGPAFAGARLASESWIIRMDCQEIFPAGLQRKQEKKTGKKQERKTERKEQKRFKPACGSWIWYVWKQEVMALKYELDYDQDKDRWEQIFQVFCGRDLSSFIGPSGRLRPD